MSKLFRWLLRGIAESAWWSWFSALPVWAYVVAAVMAAATTGLGLLSQLPAAVLVTMALVAVASVLVAVNATRNLAARFAVRPLSIEFIGGRVLRDPHLVVEIDLQLENSDIHTSWIKSARFEVRRPRGPWRSSAIVKMPQIEAPLFAEILIAIAPSPVTTADFVIYPHGLKVPARTFVNYRLRMHCYDDDHESHIRDGDYLRVRLGVMGQADELWDFSVARWPRKWHSTCDLERR